MGCRPAGGPVGESPASKSAQQGDQIWQNFAIRAIFNHRNVCFKVYAIFQIKGHGIYMKIRGL
jgi:hypothetical protein